MSLNGNTAVSVNGATTLYLGLFFPWNWSGLLIRLYKNTVFLRNGLCAAAYVGGIGVTAAIVSGMGITAK